MEANAGVRAGSNGGSPPAESVVVGTPAATTPRVDTPAGSADCRTRANTSSSGTPFTRCMTQNCNPPSSPVEWTGTTFEWCRRARVWFSCANLARATGLTNPRRITFRATVPGEGRLPGQVHLAHPAAAEQAEDLEPAEGVARLELTAGDGDFGVPSVVTRLEPPTGRGGGPPGQLAVQLGRAVDHVAVARVLLREPLEHAGPLARRGGGPTPAPRNRSAPHSG